jgi:epoxyqueuosine reductase
MSIESTSHLIKETALQLGFNSCGIARARRLDDDAARLEEWLKKGMHGKMSYMERYFDLRIDPTRLLPGARSVVTLTLNYYPEKVPDPGHPKISKYAYGKDYHDVIRSKLEKFTDIIREKTGDIVIRGFVDSAPVLERSWAQLSGLGWIGKNGNLIAKRSGSFFFIATLITDLELKYDDAFSMDHCGSCNRCVEACPTDAILPNRVVDGSKCISYFTIELKDAIFPEEMKGKFNNWIFGCDICQDVCPWNRFSQPNNTPEFSPLPELFDLSTKQWEEMTEEGFRKIFKDSPLKRSKFKGMMRNLKFILDEP